MPNPAADLTVEIVASGADQRVTVVADQVLFATAADVGKIVAVDAAGNYELVERTIEADDLSAFVRTLLDDVDAATARATLGLGTAATSAATAFETAGAAAAAQAASQPVDADLTAIAALATTTFGRALLTLAAAQSAYTQTFATANKTHAARQATGVVGTDATLASFGYTTAAQANAIVDQLNALIADVADTAEVVNALVDDLQALGLVG